MGRREKPVDPDGGPVQRLAHELRTLREAAGRPTYREMAQRTSYSTSALSQAAAGEQLPSLALVLAYAAALGADGAEWEERWRQADRAVLESATSGPGAAAPPYRGLARFEPDHGDLFFGRDQPVGQLLELVREHRFAAVLGPSGSGKSSLLRAGLIPALRQAPAPARPAVIRVLTPGERPAHTHARALTPPAGDHGAGPDTWVIVDQFEELFTLCQDPKERDRFLELLLAARRPESGLRAVVAIRGDFYGHCAEHRELADALSGADLLIGPLAPAELREAITGPATAACLTVERALTARLVDEVTGRPGALPMLSHALLETWRRRRGQALTLTAYEESGGVRGAIAATAEKVYADLSPAQARTARRILLRLVAPGDGTADTRRPAPRAELDTGAGPDAAAVLERLAAARLLTLGDSAVELAHEALMSGWPRLHGWIEEDRERLREQRRLGEAARAWEELGRDPGALYRGTRLTRAEELFADAAGAVGREDDDLTRSERDFLTAALRARATEGAAAARTTRRFRTLRTALAAFLALAVAAGALAWQQNRTGDQQRAKAAARRVAAVAESLRSSDPRTAMLLGAAAWRIAPLTETRSALLGALVQPQRATFTDPEQRKDVQRFLTGRGRTLVSVVDRRVVLRDVTSHRLISSVRLPERMWPSGVSPDARTLYLTADDGGRLWDLSAHRSAAAGPRALPHATLMNFGADGRSYLALTSSTPQRPDSVQQDSGQPGSVQLRRPADDKILFEVPLPGDRLSDAAAGPDGGPLALCFADTPLQVWDTVRRARLPGPWGSASQHGCGNSTLRFGVDGKLLAVVSAARIRVWDIPRRRLLADLTSPGGTGFTDVDLSPDGQFLATADDDELAVWRLTSSGIQVFHHPLADEAVQDLAWDPGKRRVLRFLDGATVRSYDLTANLAPRWQDAPPDAAALSPDGSVVAVVNRTGDGYRFALRATRTGAVLAGPPPLPAAEGLDPGAGAATPLLAFSPDGRALAISGTTSAHGAPRQRFTVWDVPARKVLASLDLPAAADHPTFGIALGPAGRTLLASGFAGDSAQVVVWAAGSGTLHRKGALPGFSSETVAVRPDGRLLAGSQDQYAALPAGPVTGRALSEGREVRALAFSPDGTRLAVGDSSGRVALWDGGVQHRTGVLTAGTPEAVTALAFAPDGRTLAVGGAHGALQLWDTASQQPLGTGLPTPGEEIESLAFSRDGDTVYASSAHVPLQSYPISPRQALTRICDITGPSGGSGGLTRSEWNTYIPDAPYRRICG
ncbi:WD40 repeat [Streptomyces sp. yr375]|uniref:NACHT and WD repeat domain-containing protein n=1 Tax=Streptomyces sp. yr375 TaxID=1761906 RepID=UPI0008B09C12|nr:hypothetical protein [Streptomyces sp. yr375]SER12285.1 WD40 repeat [Streptomyces sp. yr375]